MKLSKKTIFSLIVNFFYVFLFIYLIYLLFIYYDNEIVKDGNYLFIYLFMINYLFIYYNELSIYL